MGRTAKITEPSLRRLPGYHHFLTELQVRGARHVSCSTIGRELKLDPTQVRKDLEITGITGRPRVGYGLADLIHAIESFLGWNHAKRACLAGAGSLGHALLGYERFRQCGLDILAAFDTDPRRIGQPVAGCEVYALDALPELVRRMDIHIGIVTVPAPAAQRVADLMIEAGIRAIWNFAPVALSVPEPVIVQNEDLYNSLACLSFKIARMMGCHPTSTGESLSHAVDPDRGVYEGAEI